MQGQEYCKKEEGDFLLISFAVHQLLNRQRKYFTNDKAVINNDGKVNSSSKTSSKFHHSDFEFSGVLLTIIQTVGVKELLAHIEEAERREALEYKTQDLTDEDQPIKAEPASGGAAQEQEPAQAPAFPSLCLTQIGEALPPAEEYDSDGCSTPSESPTVGQDFESPAVAGDLFVFGSAPGNNWAEQQLQAVESLLKESDTKLNEEREKTDSLAKQLLEQEIELQDAIEASAIIYKQYATVQPITALRLSPSIQAKLLKTDDFDKSGFLQDRSPPPTTPPGKRAKFCKQQTPVRGAKAAASEAEARQLAPVKSDSSCSDSSDCSSSSADSLSTQ